MRGVSLALAVALALGCTETPRYSAGSSTIVRAEDGTLWLTSPDDDATALRMLATVSHA